MSTLLYEALSLAQNGLSIIPIRADGSKAPALPGWKEYQRRRPNSQEIQSAFSGNVGIAIICGSVSGNLEDIDFDDPALFDPWCALVRAQAPGLLDKLVHIVTPSGGHALVYRHDGPPTGNRKLAVARVLTDQGEVVMGDTRIETRGQGGYFLAPPSGPHCHPSHKPYIYRYGHLSRLVTISAAERALLLEAACTFGAPAREEHDHAVQRGAPTGDRPGDLFAAQASWSSILEPHGWDAVHRAGAETFWRRPGKKQGLSATSNYQGSDLFYVFSTNARPFGAERSYTKFAAYALLEHGGDYRAASRALAEQGYTTRKGAAPGGFRAHKPLEDIIYSYGVPLMAEPDGHYLKGPCPFHADAGRNLWVAPGVQHWGCRQCRITGDISDFLKRAENAVAVSPLYIENRNTKAGAR